MVFFFLLTQSKIFSNICIFSKNQLLILLSLSIFYFTLCCSVAKLCLTLCDPIDCNVSGCPVLYHLLELTQTHVHWVSDAIQTTSSSVVPFSSCLQSFPASRSFPLSQFFPSSGQSIRVSASASVLPMNIQD